MCGVFFPLLQLFHKPSKSSPAQIRRLASQVDGTRLWETHLRPILVERLPGSQGSLAVQQVCVNIYSFLPFTCSLLIFNSLLYFSTSPPPYPRFLPGGPSTWTPSSPLPLAARSPSPTSLPLWTLQPLGGCSWPATTTPRCCLQTRGPQRRYSWGPATLRCPVL